MCRELFILQLQMCMCVAPKYQNLLNMIDEVYMGGGLERGMRLFLNLTPTTIWVEYGKTCN